MNFKFFRRSRNGEDAKEQIESRTAPTLLETLTEGDRNLHDALSNYLLLDPKTQIPTLGTPESNCEKGLKCKETGNRSAARWEFELAARIALGSLDTEKAKKYLELADSVSDSPEQMIHHRTIILHLDKVKDIATQYYGGKKYVARSERIPVEAVIR